MRVSAQNDVSNIALALVLNDPNTAPYAITSAPAFVQPTALKPAQVFAPNSKNELQAAVGDSDCPAKNSLVAIVQEQVAMHRVCPPGLAIAPFLFLVHRVTRTTKSRTCRICPLFADIITTTCEGCPD